MIKIAKHKGINNAIIGDVNTKQTANNRTVKREPVVGDPDRVWSCDFDKASEVMFEIASVEFPYSSFPYVLHNDAMNYGRCEGIRFNVKTIVVVEIIVS